MSRMGEFSSHRRPMLIVSFGVDLPVVVEEAVQTPAEQPAELFAGPDARIAGDGFLELIRPIQQKIRKGAAGLAAGEGEGPVHELEGLPAQQDMLEIHAHLHRVAPCEKENVSATRRFSSQIVFGAVVPKPVIPVMPMLGTPVVNGSLVNPGISRSRAILKFEPLMSSSVPKRSRL